MGFQTLAELNTGDVLPETWVDQVKENFEVLRGSAVTSFPTGSDNQIVRFYPNGAGAPPVWMCVFDPDLNGGAGAWAFVGGAPLRTEESNQLSTAATTYQNFFTTVVIPCGGVYDIEFGGLYSYTGYMHVSIDGPGSGATDPDSLYREGLGSGVWETVSKVSRRTFTSGGTVSQYARTTSGGTVSSVSRYMSVTPVELRP